MGVLAIVAGLVAAFVPGITIFGLVILLGAWLVVQGVMEIYTAWRIRDEVTGEWILALAGGLGVIAGLIVLAMPAVGIVLTVALIATWAIVGGILAIVLGWRLRNLGRRLGSTGLATA
jgi:uncharacterized membrane protein HdeD (DUF308 family)